MDPNTMAQAREQRHVDEQAAAAAWQALPEEFVAEPERKDNGASKRKRLREALVLEDMMSRG